MVVHVVQVVLQGTFWNWRAAVARCQEKGYSAEQLVLAARNALVELQGGKVLDESPTSASALQGGWRDYAIIGPSDPHAPPGVEVMAQTALADVKGVQTWLLIFCAYLLTFWVCNAHPTSDSRISRYVVSAPSSPGASDTA